MREGGGGEGGGEGEGSWKEWNGIIGMKKS